MTARRASARPAGGGFDVYDGREAVGSIEPTQGGFLARCARGRALGTYPTSKEAVRVIVRLSQERGAP